jgi:hypothetical protein
MLEPIRITPEGRVRRVPSISLPVADPDNPFDIQGNCGRGNSFVDRTKQPLRQPNHGALATFLFRRALMREHAPCDGGCDGDFIVYPSLHQQSSFRTNSRSDRSVDGLRHAGDGAGIFQQFLRLIGASRPTAI